MRKPRDGHVAFKMENYLYVAGGIDGFSSEVIDSCEHYDIENNTCFSSQHSLPRALEDAFSVVSLDESFAVITGR